MNDYEVGQILYLTNEKSFKIIPVQVIEEVVRTTISGKIKTYLIQFPDKNKTVADISNIKYKHFKTQKEVKDYLMDNTRKAIDRLLDVANELKNEAYAVVTPEAQVVPTQSKPPDIINYDLPVQQDNEPDIIKVDLGNGQTGKFKVEDINKVVK